MKIVERAVGRGGGWEISLRDMVVKKYLVFGISWFGSILISWQKNK